MRLQTAGSLAGIVTVTVKTAADTTDCAWSRRHAVAKEDTRHCWLDTSEDGGRRAIIAETLETVADANEDTRRS
jgi:hypothetical protein